MIQFNQLKKNQMSENENKKIPPPPPPPPPNDRLIKEGQEPPKPKGEKRDTLSVINIYLQQMI
jgi:hypothetical protein